MLLLGAGLGFVASAQPWWRATGNGASVAAIEGGRSVDTSMGLTPLEGLVMGTRSGDLDPAVPLFLCREAGLTPVEVDRLLNRESGLKGLCGENDMRAVLDRAGRGDADAELALAAYCHRLRKYVGAYAAAMGRLDAVVLTGGIGENSAYVRSHALAGLELLGLSVDEVRNAAPDRSPRRISPDGSPAAVVVVPTDEEAEIARQTLAVLVG